jgi:uncharacterized membrane protein YfcA
MAPPLLILVLLLLVLGDAARKGVRSAVNISAKEEKEDKEPQASGVESTPVAQADAVCERSRAAQLRLFLVWLLCIALVATKGLVFPMCSPIWWILTIGSAVILCGISWMYAGTLSAQVPVDADDLDFREMAHSLAQYSILAGTIAALCGIGGGMIMGPILIEMKVPPPVSTATTATTLVVLSTSTLLIYICRGMAPPSYAICLSMFTLMGAFVGKIVANWWIQKTGKQSALVWTLAGVTVCSMVLMGLEGILTLKDDPGGSFAFRDFCKSPLHENLPKTDF